MITCGGDKSGSASKFVFLSAQNEAIVKTKIEKSTRNLFLILYEIILSTIITNPLYLIHKVHS